jgi:hypothetical protein
MSIAEQMHAALSVGIILVTTGVLIYFALILWKMHDDRRAMLHDLAPRGYLKPGRPWPRADRAPLELSFDGWIRAETDQTFAEWIEANSIPQKVDLTDELVECFRIEMAASYAGKVETGTLRASLPRGGSAEVWPMKPDPPPAPPPKRPPSCLDTLKM